MTNMITVLRLTRLSTGLHCLPDVIAEDEAKGSCTIPTTYAEQLVRRCCLCSPTLIFQDVHAKVKQIRCACLKVHSATYGHLDIMLVVVRVTVKDAHNGIASFQELLVGAVISNRRVLSHT